MKIAFVIEEQNLEYIINFQKPVALKITHDQDIIKEGSTAAKLVWHALYPTHPIADVKRDARAYVKQYLVMPYISGVNLTHFMEYFIFSARAGFGVTNLTQKIKLALAIIDAVMKLHELGIVHGDLKPDNIIIQRNEHDIFVAHLIDLDRSQRSGECIGPGYYGTPEYFSPEIVMAVKRRQQLIVNFTLDIYALGIVLAAIFIDEFGSEQHLGIIHSRLRALSTNALAYENFDSVLPNSENLEGYPWFEKYLAIAFSQEQQASSLYAPLITTMQAMMRGNREQRPALREVKSVFEPILKKIQRFELHCHCDYITPRVQAMPSLSIPKISASQPLESELFAVDLRSPSSSPEPPSPSRRKKTCQIL